jgi:hypothetical protein
MTKLKEVYNIKKQLITTDINELGDILKENSNIDTININTDNTIYLESNCGMDSIKDILNLNIIKWANCNIEAPVSMLYNALPITNNSCIVRI